MSEIAYTKKEIAELVDGRLVPEGVHRMLSMPKDAGRFKTYLAVLQERVKWPHRIILPYAARLYVTTADKGADWVIRCECGHEFCGWRQNWKLEARVHVRDTKEKLDEVYPRLMSPDPSWQVLREYYCPECGTLHDVEAPTPWYPVIHDFEPDIEAFYTEWLGEPVPAGRGPRGA